MEDSRMYCLGCYYDLQGLVEFRCPECGRFFDPDNARTFSAVPRPERLKKIFHNAASALSDAMGSMKPGDATDLEALRLKNRILRLELENRRLQIYLESILTVLGEKGVLDMELIHEMVEARLLAGDVLEVVDDRPAEEDDEPTSELMELGEVVEERKGNLE